MKLRFRAPDDELLEALRVRMRPQGLVVNVEECVIPEADAAQST
jgi:hypothetical protein